MNNKEIELWAKRFEKVVKQTPEGYSIVVCHGCLTVVSSDDIKQYFDEHDHIDGISELDDICCIMDRKLVPNSESI